MMDRLDELDWSAISIAGHRSAAERVQKARGVFWTLTYAEFSNDPKSWKRDFESFWKVARRRWGEDISCVWKLESQGNRAFKSGLTFVPHFHLSVDLKREVDQREMRAWLSLAWFRIAGRGNEKHLRAGTRCDVIYNDGKGKLRGYLSKYLAKVQDAESNTGRIWGERGVMVEAIPETGTCSWVEISRRVRRVRPDNHYYRDFGKVPIVRGEVDGKTFAIMPSVIRYDSDCPGELMRGLLRPPAPPDVQGAAGFTGSFPGF
jgi:hypothetical protein